MNGLYRQVSLRVLPILFCCYLVNYIDRVNVSFAQLHLSSALKLGPAAYGTGAGLFFIGYFLFQVPSNLLLNRIGARRCITLIILVWGVLSAGTAFVTNERQFYVLRFLLGAAEAGFFPGVILYLTRWYPSTIRARIFALFLTAIPIAGLIGGPLSGWILDHADGFGLGLASWQWLFILESLPCLALAHWVFHYLPDQPADATWLSPHDRETLTAELATDLERTVPASSQQPSVLSALLHPTVLKLCALYFCTMMGLYALSFWLPQIIKALGWSGGLQIGLISAIPWSVAVVFMLLLGRSSDRHGERRLHTIGAALIGTLGFALCGLTHNPTVGLIAISLAASGVMGMMAVQWSLPGTLLRGTAAAAGIALVNSCGNLGGFVSPKLIGELTERTHNDAIGLYLTAGMMLVAALILHTNRSLQPT